MPCFTAQAFLHPAEVVNDPDLTLNEKGAILASWASDACAVESVPEAQIIVESWRRHFNTIRPHASLGHKPPAPEVFVPAFAAWPAALPRPASPARLTLAQRPTLN